MSLQLDSVMMSRLHELARQVAEREGCQLYDIEFVGGSRGQGRLVRVFIDKPAHKMNQPAHKIHERGPEGALVPEDAVVLETNASTTAEVSTAVEVAPERNVFSSDTIDSDNEASATERGVSIDDCANVSRGLNLLLDVEDVIPGGTYTLEVSSPGLDRLLKVKWHFQVVVGKRIWIKTTSSMEAERVRRQATGLLEGATDTSIHIQVDNKVLVVPYDIIERARVVVEWSEDAAPQGRKKNEPRSKGGG